MCVNGGGVLKGGRGGEDVNVRGGGGDVNGGVKRTLNVTSTGQSQYTSPHLKLLLK